LNNDTIVTPDAISMLVRSARREPRAGPIGPRVTRDWPGAKPASLGERYWAALAWMPRSLLRRRWPRQRAYPARGVLGCAMLVSRSLFERLGGFDEGYFAYYEEVDYCLRAWRAGLRPLVEPCAEIAHRGHRGFGSGLNFVAAYLKARNLWRLGQQRVGVAGRLLFVPGYFLMLVASIAGYTLRGQIRVVRGMLAGMTAGFRGEQGPPPSWIFSGASGPTGKAEISIEGGPARS
jgi:GT2 family glycosyltransferase